MVKHFDIKIEGDLDGADFNYYCQTGAFKFNINAVYVNGNSRDVELSAEGNEQELENYIQFLKDGPLKPFIETFEVSEKNVEGIQGFTSHRHYEDPPKSIFSKLFKKK